MSMFRIIQNWIIQSIHVWMAYRHVQNHPDLDIYFWMAYRIVQIWMVQIIQIQWMISSTFQFYSRESRHISSKFGWYFTTLTNHPHFENLCGSQIIHFWKQNLPRPLVLVPLNSQPVAYYRKGGTTSRLRLALSEEPNSQLAFHGHRKRGS